MARPRKNTAAKNNGAPLGFEATLWASADKLRNNMDAAEYKHVVLGLIFLKYISDAFEERYAQLLQEKDQGADPEDSDEYLSENVFWVPKEARWKYGALPVGNANFAWVPPFLSSLKNRIKVA